MIFSTSVIILAFKSLLNGAIMNATKGALTSSWSAEKLVGFIVFLFLIDALAILGNTLVILVIFWTKSLRRMEPNLFVVSLSIADLLVALTIVPITIASLVDPQHFPYDAYKTFLGFGNFFFCICSIMNLTLLSLDRYFSITSPYRYLDFMTHKRACYLCVLVWVYSLGISLPPVFGISSYACFIPNFDTCSQGVWQSSGTLVFALLVLGLTYVISLLSMSFCYWKIFMVARSHSRRIAVQLSIRTSNQIKSQTVGQNPKTIQKLNIEFPKAGEFKSVSIATSGLNSCYGQIPEIVHTRRPQDRRLKRLGTEQVSLHSISSGTSKIPDPTFTFRSTKNELRVARSFLVIIGLYVLCWTPFCLILAAEIFIQRKLSEEASLICLWLGYINSCVNPFIYTWKYRQFRSALIRLWRKTLEKMYCSS